MIRKSSLDRYLPDENLKPLPVVSREMIEPQLNDSVLPHLDELFETLIGKFKSRAGKKELFITLDEIDRVITDRFGYRFKHILLPGSGAYACIPLPPEEYNALRQEDIRELYGWFKSYGKDIGAYAGDDIDVISPMEPETSDRTKRFYGNIIRSIDTMHDALGKGITIDLKRAKINGLNKNYCVYVVMDPDTLIDAGINNKEMVAILLHEIGHTFTHIEYSYKTIANTSVLVDTLLDNVRNKNMSPKESLLIAYKQITRDPEADKLKSSGTITCYLTIASRLCKHFQPNPQDHAYTDSEQLADQFAGRFGRGKELAVALDKIGKLWGWGKGVEFTLRASSYTLFLVAICALCIAFPPFLPVAVIVTINGLVYLYYRTWPDVPIYEKATYDDEKRRFERIRNETVRLIRTANLDKNITKRLLENLSTIDAVLQESPDRAEGPLAALWGVIFTNGAKLKEMKKIEQLVEDLGENDLHVASAKLKINA